MNVRVSLPCAHRGEIIELVRTYAREPIEIYSCSVHGRCTYDFLRNTLMMCNRCTDRKSDVNMTHDNVGHTDVGMNLPPLVRDGGDDILSCHDGGQHDKMASHSNGEANDSKGAGVADTGRSPLRGRLPIQGGNRPLGAYARSRSDGRSPSVSSTPTAPRTPRYVPALESDNLKHEQQLKHWQRPPVWEYGITTVPSRRLTTFPVTLKSLVKSGFDKPRLFLDGDDTSFSVARSYSDEYGLPVTCRVPKIRTAGNWLLGMAELYIRNPDADYYAMFQDDFVTSLNLRTYLEALQYPDKGYWNLYTFPENQVLSNGRKGFYPSNRRGKGAVALVFSREAVMKLLSHHHLTDRVGGADRIRRYKFIDGAIVEAMNQMGWVEHVHNPSLVQHIGLKSSMNNLKQPLAPSFKGEDYDLTDLLKVRNPNG